MTPTRRIHSHDSLRDIAESMSIPLAYVEQDYVLVTIAAKLAADFGDGLCFKGGFVLRHAYGLSRMSFDLDATRLNPPREPLDSEAVRQSIQSARKGSLVSLKVAAPKTDTDNSLDFESVRYTGQGTGVGISPGTVAVEVSYREAVVLEPLRAMIGPPYYEPFPVPVLQHAEFAGEKLRTLAQRLRPTDLADLAFLLQKKMARPEDIAQVVPVKFAKGLVRQGNPSGRIHENILALAAEYDTAVPDLAPDAMSYADARDVVMAHLPVVLERL